MRSRVYLPTYILYNSIGIYRVYELWSAIYVNYILLTLDRIKALRFLHKM